MHRLIHPAPRVELLKSSYVNRGASLIYTERDLMGVNSVTLVGRAGRDPEVRYFESGSMVANLTIAVNRRSRDDEPDWFNLEIWGKQAQVAADYVKKGSLLGIIGSFKLDRWTDRNSGEERSKPVVRWRAWSANRLTDADAKS